MLFHMLRSISSIFMSRLLAFLSSNQSTAKINVIDLYSETCELKLGLCCRVVVVVYIFVICP